MGRKSHAVAESEPGVQRHDSRGLIVGHWKVGLTVDKE